MKQIYGFVNHRFSLIHIHLFHHLSLHRTFVTLDTRKALMAAASDDALVPRSGYTEVSSAPDTLNKPLLEEDHMSSSYAPSDAGGEQKKEVAETPAWWEN